MIKHNYNGIFIAFEGLDGSGASTQVSLLEKNLRNSGEKAFSSKEPTNNLIGGLIRGVLTKEWKMPPDGFQLLYAADRSHHLAREIIPTLKEGNIMILDRYAFSSYAFGSIDLPLQWIENMHQNFILPDITFFIKVKPEICLDRIKKSRNGFEYYEELEKLKQTLKTYELLAENKANNIIVIDGEKKIEDIEKEIFAIVEAIIRIKRQSNLNKEKTREARW